MLLHLRDSGFSRLSDREGLGVQEGTVATQGRCGLKLSRQGPETSFVQNAQKIKPKLTANGLMPIFIFIIAHWYLAAFCQTFFLHRYAAHRMFSMPLSWQRVFYVLTFLTQGSSYLNPRAYALLHRMHHAYSDTEKDPHSPLFYRTPFAMMKNTLFMYLDAFSGKVKQDKNLQGYYPEWPAFDRWADPVLSRFGFMALYVFFYLRFATAWWMYLFLPLHFFMGPIHGAIVNWCGHKYGYANYDNQDASKNTFFADLLTMGELMQNNHHRHSNCPNFAVRWFEFDPTYGIIRLFGFLRIVQLSR